MSKPDAAQLIAGIALGVMTLILAAVGPREPIAQGAFTYKATDGADRHVTRGSVIPAIDAGAVADAYPVRWIRRSPLGAILAGTDNRTSTSKTVVFAWTLAVAFGLLSLVVAVWLGDHEPWDAQVARGLQEEYLLLLGGPYAAAVLAKYATSSQADTKTAAAPGDAAPSQLITNDSGGTDIGDFQYVLFNAIGLTFFLGDFIGGLEKGFPVLPALLTGLMLTSTGAYSAKKLLAQAAPTLISVLPTSGKKDAKVQVFATNVALPASVSGTGEQMDAKVFVGAHEATVSAHDLVIGNDRLTFTVPAEAEPGPAPISVVRADGVRARDANGVTVLAFEVLATPPTLDKPRVDAPR